MPLPYYSMKLVKEDELFRVCDRHTYETVTLCKIIAENEYVRKMDGQIYRRLRVVAFKLPELT